MYLYASHDSMIVPLLVALGCYDWEWPPYASFLAYELWRHNDNGGHYVRLTYNGKVSTSICARIYVSAILTDHTALSSLGPSSTR